MIALLLAAALAATPEAPRELTLEEALSIAAKSQPQLAQARAQVDAAQARADQARAGLLPRLDVSGSYLRSTGNFAARPGQVPGNLNTQRTTSFDTFGFWNTSATARQLIWDFGGVLGRLRAASDQAEAQRKDAHLTAIAVAQGVREAFFLARTNRELVGVADAALRNQQAHLEQIRGFVGVGKRPEIDLSQARADVANARVALIQARNDYATAKARLDQAMGVTAPFAYEVASETVAPVAEEDAPLDQLVDAAVAARPDLDALKAQVHAQESLASSARAAYFPSLDAQLQATGAGADLGALVPNASGQLTLTWNLFEGGATMATVSEAQALARSLAAQLELARQQVRLEVEQAQLTVHAALEAQTAAREAAEAARDRLRLAEGRYQAGVGTALELSDAQSALTQAEAQLVQASNAVSTARAQLLYALGRG